MEKKESPIKTGQESKGVVDGSTQTNKPITVKHLARMSAPPSEPLGSSPYNTRRSAKK